MELTINESSKNTNTNNNPKGLNNFNSLAQKIQIDGIVANERYINSNEDRYYHSTVIRLIHKSHFHQILSLKLPNNT